MALNFGFGSSRSKSQSSSFGFDQSQQVVDPSQAPFLDFLRNRAQTLAGGQDLSGLFGVAQGLGQQGQGFLGQLTNNPFLGALQQQAGGNPALVAQQTGQLGQDIGRFFNQQLLPGIQGQAVAAGQLGGGRQGVAQGLAAQSALDAFSRGATDIQTQDAQRSLAAAQAGGGLLGQGAATGLGNLGTLFGLAQSPFDAQFNPLLNLASILGDPTVLGSSFGLNRAQSTSKSKSRSFSLGGL